jgi:hypothetical protein
MSEDAKEPAGTHPTRRVAERRTQLDQVQILETWLGPLREKELLTLGRRRTQRVLMRVPVRVSGQNTRASQIDE